MPVIIKELVVHAHVVENKNQGKNNPPTEQEQSNGTKLDPAQKKMIIDESVQQVLEILDRKMNR